MRRLIITRKDDVFKKLVEAAELSNNSPEPIEICVGSKLNDIAILIGDEFWNQILGEIFRRSDFIMNGSIGMSSYQPSLGDNPEFEALKRLINSINNGFRGVTGIPTLSNVATADTGQIFAVLLAVQEWESIEETLLVAKILSRDDGLLPFKSFDSISNYASSQNNYRVELVLLASTQEKKLLPKLPGKIQERIRRILEGLKTEPRSNDCHFEILSGDLRGYCSKRVDYNNRVIYKISDKESCVEVVRIYGHQ